MAQVKHIPYPDCPAMDLYHVLPYGMWVWSDGSCAYFRCAVAPCAVWENGKFTGRYE